MMGEFVFVVGYIYVRVLLKQSLLRSHKNVFCLHVFIRGAWAIFPGAQPTEQPRRVPKVADRGMTFS